jgi:hypothetical protein
MLFLILLFVIGLKLFRESGKASLGSLRKTLRSLRLIICHKKSNRKERKKIQRKNAQRRLKSRFKSWAK